MLHPRSPCNVALIYTKAEGRRKAGHPKHDEVDAIRSSVWMHYICRRSGMSVTEIDGRYCRKVPNADPPKLAQRWASGSVSSSAPYIRKFDDVVPGSRECHDWILWPLLRQRCISEDKIFELLGRYLNPNGSPGDTFYKFPRNIEERNFDYRRHIVSSIDVPSLLLRNDHYGFMAILALVRFAETTHLPLFHRDWAMSLYRAFPGLVRHPDLAPFRDTLLSLVTAVVVRRIGILDEFTIDGDLLFEYIDSHDLSIPGMDIIVGIQHQPLRPIRYDVMKAVSYDLYCSQSDGLDISPALIPTYY